MGNTFHIMNLDKYMYKDGIKTETTMENTLYIIYPGKFMNNVNI